MPRANQGEVEYHYDDHDSDYVNEVPPVQNTWYTVFDAEDVRLIWHTYRQKNDEAAVKDVEVRWTIDGTVYFLTQASVNNTIWYVYRWFYPSTVGTLGLSLSTDPVNAAYYVDKRGKAFKVELRLTGVPGTNQVLESWAVRETQDVT